MKKLNLVNNTYGFNYGDQMIREIAGRIEEALDEEYKCYRVERHIFAIWVADFTNSCDLVALINKIEESVGNHMMLKNEEIHIELSTGVGVSLGDATRGCELLAKAQTALDQVDIEKKSDTYAFYTSEMDVDAQLQLYEENDVYRAYENDEFIPYFQPFIDIKTGEISGLEALMRRRNCQGEIIAPNEFIEILERVGLIEKIELSFIRKVCEQIRKWIDEGKEVVPVAINISPLQFSNTDLVKNIILAVNQVGIPRELITIEILESMFIENLELAKSVLKEFKDQGFLIAIDDFGTGYSSLSYLKEFNADQLKIDISFIKNITNSKGDEAIVKAIIALAKALDMKTVAEGIETSQQLDLINQLGCNIGQGHYWDPALPPDEIARKYL